MGELLGELKRQLLPILVMVAVLALLGFLAWRKLFGNKSPGEVVGDTFNGALEIAGGLPSLIGSKLRGESEATYITAADQRRLAQEALARKRAGL